MSLTDWDRQRLIRSRGKTAISIDVKSSSLGGSRRRNQLRSSVVTKVGDPIKEPDKGNANRIAQHTYLNYSRCAVLKIYFCGD